MEKELERENRKSLTLLRDLDALEDYAHDLFVFSPLSICFISPSGIFLETNPAFENLSNYSSNEIVGKSIETFFEKEKIGLLLEKLLTQDIAKSVEIKIFPKDKKSALAQIFVSVRRNEQGSKIGFFFGIFDLSEIKQTEKELKRTQTALLNILEDTEREREKAEEEKRKTQAIIVNFTDGLLVFDNQNRLTSMNLQAEKLLNVKSKKLIGKSIIELSKIPKTEMLVKQLKGDVKIFRQEFKINKELTLEFSTVLLETEEQNTGFLIVLHDVTREKIIERLKTEFVSISAHQLRTPLSAIKWTLKMLLDGDLGGITTEQEEFLQRTYRSNERMIKLVNSLLDVSRIEEGRFMYKPVLHDFTSMVETFVGNYKDEAKRRKINLKFIKPKKKLPKVLIDREKIGLALQNLLDNALKYTLGGGNVTVSLKKVGQEIEFKIKDTGIGIPKFQHERVFKKFFRSEGAIRLETEGSGLGLFIVKNVVEAHGGKIRFESNVNEGSTFWFTLPIKVSL